MNINDDVINYMRSKGTLELSPEEILGYRYLDKGLIDSMGIVELIAHLEGLYGIYFEADDLESEEFQTIGGLIRLIEEKTGRPA